MSIETIEPTDQLAAAIRKPKPRKRGAPIKKLDWKQIKEAYNRLAVGGSVILRNEDVHRLTNVHKVIEKRGLDRQADYDLSRQNLPNLGLRVIITRRSLLDMA